VKPRRLLDATFSARMLVRAGVVRFERWGPTPASGYAISALRVPRGGAVSDDRGTVGFSELHEQTNALAHSLRERGVREGDFIAIFCRDHRGFIQATVAASKLGANVLLLNTSFAAPEISEICATERPAVVIFDEEFRERCAAIGDALAITAFTPPGATPRSPTLEELIAEGSRKSLTPPRDRGRVVILTSGTTGAPKGASRRQPRSLEPAAALFSKIPLRARETTLIAAPLFHSWGYAHFTLGLALSSTLVLRRRFDPERTLEAIARHDVNVLVLVPIMLQRILDLPPETISAYRTPALRVIAVSGSALPGELALRAMDTFGEVLYNLYGSTEVAWATIATPADLRAAPGTAGRPPRGTRVALYDTLGRPVSGVGETGRIFVANEMVMDGYTSGDGKQMIDGLIATGDVGYFDAHGRLFVSGRDDEMIISGGENVFPREIEDLLAAHEAIEDVAVVGVRDAEFGERLRAFVVCRTGVELAAVDVKDYVRENLARFKVPRDVVFVDELPRTATGKVLKRELRERGDR